MLQYTTSPVRTNHQNKYRFAHLSANRNVVAFVLTRARVLTRRVVARRGQCAAAHQLAASVWPPSPLRRSSHAPVSSHRVRSSNAVQRAVSHRRVLLHGWAEPWQAKVSDVTKGARAAVRVAVEAVHGRRAGKCDSRLGVF